MGDKRKPMRGNKDADEPLLDAFGQAAGRLAGRRHLRAPGGGDPHLRPGAGGHAHHHYVSLDPYQWGYKRRGLADKPGQPCHARTVSEIVCSRMPGFEPGDLVFNTNGWS